MTIRMIWPKELKDDRTEYKPKYQKEREKLLKSGFNQFSWDKSIDGFRKG